MFYEVFIIANKAILAINDLLSYEENIMLKTLKDAQKEGVQENNIYCADCLDIMKLMPDKSVDLVLTDPPL